MHNKAGSFAILAAILRASSLLIRFADRSASWLILIIDVYIKSVVKRAGIQVIYCAEHFDNDGSPFSALLKAIKRAAAAE